MRQVGLVFGVGINDADYSVKEAVCADKKVIHTWVCPYYEYWRHMIGRCYSKVKSTNNSSYSDCFVCDDWLYFSKFKAWMKDQDWNGKQLDKDLINPKSNLYCPENCAFVTKRTNTFITNSIRKGSERKPGYTKKGQRYKAQCRNPFTGKNEYIGSYDSPDEANKAWKKRKHEIAIMLSETESDERVKRSLCQLFI